MSYSCIWNHVSLVIYKPKVVVFVTPSLHSRRHSKLFTFALVSGVKFGSEDQNTAYEAISRMNKEVKL